MIPVVPMLIVTADAECLITVNGEFAGVCPAGGFAPCPVAAKGEYFIRAEPLCEGLVPIVRRLTLTEAGAELTGGDCRVWSWPNSVYEAALTLPRLPRPAPRPAALSSVKLGDGRTVTLFRDGGLRLTVEENGRPAAGCALGDGENAELGLYECDGRRFIGVTAEGRITAGDGQLNTLLDVECDRGEFIDGRPTATFELNTLRRHRTAVSYAFDGAAFVARDGVPAPAACEPQDVAEKAICCIEAVREGFFAEALTYMSRELKQGLDLAAVREFLGEFTEVRRPFNGDIHILGIADGNKESPTAVRLLEIEYRDGLVDNIAEL